jgi:ATP-dependent DNA ligase
VRVFTRRGFDWTAKYGPLAEAAKRLPVSSAIIDGEVIVTDSEDRPDFGVLRSAIMTQPDRLSFVAFDLLHLAGQSLPQWTDARLAEDQELCRG